MTYNLPFESDVATKQVRCSRASFHRISALVHSFSVSTLVIQSLPYSAREMAPNYRKQEKWLLASRIKHVRDTIGAGYRVQADVDGLKQRSVINNASASRSTELRDCL